MNQLWNKVLSHTSLTKGKSKAISLSDGMLGNAMSYLVWVAVEDKNKLLTC